MLKIRKYNLIILLTIATAAHVNSASIFEQDSLTGQNALIHAALEDSKEKPDITSLLKAIQAAEFHKIRGIDAGRVCEVQRIAAAISRNAVVSDIARGLLGKWMSQGIIGAEYILSLWKAVDASCGPLYDEALPVYSELRANIEIPCYKKMIGRLTGKLPPEKKEELKRRGDIISWRDLSDFLLDYYKGHKELHMSYELLRSVRASIKQLDEGGSARARAFVAMVGIGKWEENDYAQDKITSYARLVRSLAEDLPGEQKEEIKRRGIRSLSDLSPFLLGFYKKHEPYGDAHGALLRKRADIKSSAEKGSAIANDFVTKMRIDEDDPEESKAARIRMGIDCVPTEG